MRVSTLLLLIFFSLTIEAHGDAPSPPPIVAVRAARLLDVRSGRIVSPATVVIEGEQIAAAGANVTVPASARVIDLGDATLLPGLIDCHTHLLARLDGDGDQAYALALLTKSEAYRALEGAASARATLQAGFTTVRDVESEGAGYADVALRDAIRRGLVEGPRMLVATRGIAAVGDYQPFGISPDLRDFPTGAQLVSGVEEARRAAREQLGHGADLLKVYADWVHPTLTVDEMRVVVEEAHKRGHKVAAHADSAAGMRNALAAGVDSIEHGSEADPALLALMKQKHVFWVPTRAAFTAPLKKSPPPPRVRRWLEDLAARARRNLATARQLGVEVAAGFDADHADDQGHDADELVELHRLGLTPIEAIRAATVNAAELIGWPDRVGTVEKGRYGDLIAVAGDPLADITQLQHVRFVMKGGVVIKDELKRPAATSSAH